jgi:hypothetical protein
MRITCTNMQVRTKKPAFDSFTCTFMQLIKVFVNRNFKLSISKSKNLSKTKSKTIKINPVALQSIFTNNGENGNEKLRLDVTFILIKELKK